MKHSLLPLVMIMFGILLHLTTVIIQSQPNTQTVEYKSGSSTVCDGRTLLPNEKIAGNCWVVEGEVGPTSLGVGLVIARVVALAAIAIGAIWQIATFIKNSRKSHAN